MNILIIGDCHGEMPEIPDEEFEVVLCVGDVCGGTDEMRSAMFQAMDEERTWYEVFGEEEARNEVENSIEEGRKILEKLDSLGVPVFVVPGNWDWTGENSDWGFLDGKGYPKMLEGLENVEDLNFDRREIEDWRFIGYGPCSGPEIPQYEDDEPDSREELEEIRQEYREKKQRLSDLFDRESRTVFLSHNVPQESSLDRIDDPENPVHGRHYGSFIVRELIEEFSPNYSVAGHMHEGEGMESIEDTHCLNTGLNNVWMLDTQESGFRMIDF